MSPSCVLLDLNNPIFQKDWFSLPKEEAERLRSALKQIAQMTWPQVYQSKGLRWEEIVSKTGPRGEKLYSIRITDKFRALVFREIGPSDSTNVTLSNGGLIR